MLLCWKVYCNGVRDVLGMGVGMLWCCLVGLMCLVPWNCVVFFMISDFFLKFYFFLNLLFLRLEMVIFQAEMKKNEKKIKKNVS